ncbi:MAG: zinc ribbon domain-containing protein [Patescibacteria group bacterium]|jgi:membrane protease subunit (stomatin/prohibitin family)
MAEEIELSLSYNDLSTDNGFQYEFICGRCNKGIRTKFKGFALGTASGILNAANDIFGGVLGTAADIGEKVHSSAWEKAHDEAFEEALEEVREHFIQCPRCQTWVCRRSCWNLKKGLCKECAPDLGVEMAAAQASKSVEEVWAHAAMAEEDKKLDKEHWREGIAASCPKCEAPLPANVKFCPECGANVKQKNVCAKCGAKLAPKAKFCGECGTKVAA